MKLIKIYKFKLNFIGWISQLLPFLLYFALTPKYFIGNWKFVLAVVVVGWLNRFPHEYLHKWGGYLVGVDSVIDFRKINPTCTPKSILNQKQAFVFSIMPFLVLSIFYSLMAFIAFHMGSSFLFYLFFALFVFLFASCAGDFGYVYNSLKCKGCLFKDTGNTLEIYNP